MPAIDPPGAPRRSSPSFDDAAIERLDVLLHEAFGERELLPLEAVDGLFSAAAVSPGEPVQFQELLPLIFGKLPEAPGPELLALLQAMWEWVRWRIARGSGGNPDQAAPLLALPREWCEAEAFEVQPDESEGAAAETGVLPMIGMAWAVGFIMGSGLRNDEWVARLERNPQMIPDIAAILALAPASDGDGDDAEAALEWLSADVPGDGINGDGSFEVMPETPLDLETRLEIIDTLAELLCELHLLTIEERSVHLPQRSPPGPGRNDSCPCGSGLKFKKCHGSPARLN